MQASSETCAREILEVVPLVMRAIRSEMRQRRAVDLSVPQFRTLLFIQRHPGTSLSRVAGYIGLTLPSTSKMVDGLVGRQLVQREISPADRRQITLTLTERGKSILETARQGTQAHLAEILSALDGTERDQVAQAMQALRQVFAPGERIEAAFGR